ncbi:hypothetical protein B0A49_12064, partial [Cryomyces minteri]
MLPLRPLDDTAAAASDTTTIDPLSLLEGSKGETDTVAGMNGFVQTAGQTPSFQPPYPPFPPIHHSAHDTQGCFLIKFHDSSDRPTVG